MITPFTLALAFLVIIVIAMHLFAGSFVIALPALHVGGM